MKPHWTFRLWVFAPGVADVDGAILPDREEPAEEPWRHGADKTRRPCVIPADQKETILHGFRDDDLEFYIRGRLGLREVSAIEAHLVDCETCRDRLSRLLRFRVLPVCTGETRPRAYERRSEPRFASGDEGTIQELHPLSPKRRKVRITNVSKNGLGLLTSEFLSPGTIVQLRVGSTITLGEVRHCLAHGDGYSTGLRLQRDI